MSNKVIILIMSLQFLALTNAQFDNFCVFQPQNGDYVCQLFNAQYNIGDDFVMGGQHVVGFDDSQVTSLVAMSDEEFPASLQTIPSEISQRFPNLLELDLTNTNIEFVPKLENCLSLQNLFLGLNRIGSITPGAFESCTSLLSLNLESNILSEFDNLIAMLSPTLTNLILRSNTISTLTADSFRGLDRLRVLNLNGNGVINIAENTFFYAGTLEELNLENNRIAILSSNMFINMPQLNTLNLSDNLIEAVQRGFFMYFPNLRSLGFRNNFCANVELELPIDDLNAEFTYCYTIWDVINGQETTLPGETDTPSGDTTISIELPTQPTPPGGETTISIELPTQPTPPGGETTISIELPTQPTGEETTPTVPDTSTEPPTTDGSATQSIFTVLSLCMIAMLKMIN